MIPKQLKTMRFNRVQFKDKKAFENGWQNKPYSYNEIQNYFPKENYGVMCGSELRVLDDDTPNKGLITLFLENFGETFRVRDHLYFKFDNGHDNKIIFKHPILKFDDGKGGKTNHMGELQGRGTYVVGAGSMHPSGEIYEVKNDEEIKTISFAEFEKVFGEYFSSNVNKEQPVEKINNVNDDDFIKSIKEQWNVGNRQDLAMSLAGYLRKNKKLGLNSAISIITNICLDCGDEELNSRIAAVRATYEKDEKDIKGISGLEEHGIRKQVVVMSKFSPVPFAKDIMNGNRFVYDKYGMFWIYDNKEGVWKNNAEKLIRTELRNNLFGDEQQKKSYVEEVVSYIKELNYDEDFETNNNPYLIAFKNKVYNLQEDSWEDFKPEHYLTNKIDIDIDENIKECPKIDNFFSESIGEEYKDILYDLLAYCLFRQMPYQKIFFVYGPAGTGKSKYMELIEKFLGEDNVCSFEPVDIQKDPYAPSQMLYKYANVSSDISYNALDNVNQAKKLSGGDTMKIRLMYKEPHNAKVYCKQIFSTNKMPEVKEKTQAWYRRVYPIPFYNIIEHNKRNPFLINEMTTKEELQGLAYKCIEKLKELKNNKFVFRFDIDEREIANLYEDLSNPIRKFIRENHEISKNNSDCWTYQFDFKERLNNWLKANQYPEMTNREINEYMRENFNESNRPNLRGDGVYRVWVGLKKQKSAHNPEFLNQFNHFWGSEKKPIYIEKKFQNLVKSVKPVKEVKNEKKYMSIP